VELPASAQTFIVRVTADGAIAGTVERVRTGEKHRFRGLESLAALIVQMMTYGRQPSAGTGGEADEGDQDRSQPTSL
jgi:hypothetical protein